MSLLGDSLPNSAVGDISAHNLIADMGAYRIRSDKHVGANRFSLPQFENARTLRNLTGKMRIMAAVSQFSRRESNKEPKKILIRSERWIRLAKFLEFAPRDELKEPISLVLRDVNR